MQGQNMPPPGIGKFEGIPSTSKILPTKQMFFQKLNEIQKFFAILREQIMCEPQEKLELE